MKYIRICTSLFIPVIFLSAFIVDNNDWGFFAHRRINRLAVFTLHMDIIGFYKQHIEYLTAHATDPDMRRYVVPIEGQKHFIDLDRWETETLPTTFREIRRLFTEIVIIDNNQDTLQIFGKNVPSKGAFTISLKGKNFPKFFNRDSVILLAEDYHDFFHEHVYHPQYFETWKLNCDSIQAFFNFHGFELDCRKAYALDTFVIHGVLPYNLIRMQTALTNAMVEENLDKILRISADMGHYIGDAHVPLHTTSNYNGQQTNQLGIHAFWETRLPEMFADDTYDFLVGQSEYIYDIRQHYWRIVRESNALVDEVLSIEKALSLDYPEDQQDCFVERGEGYIQKTACEEYARLYHEKLNGQVERQFRSAIKAVGDAWYTAWVDAGQPDLQTIFDNRKIREEIEVEKKLKDAVLSNKILGREH